MPYVAGVVTVPGATGTVSTSLPGTPALIIFQGTNFLTEDTVVTSGPGGAAKRALFRGHCGRAWDNPSAQYQNSVSLLANHAIGRQWRNSKAVTCIHHTTVGATLYEASCAFTGGGFDLTFNVAAAGGYKIVYFAIYNLDNAVSMGTVIQSGFSEDIGFTPRAMVAYGQRSGGGTGADSVNAAQTSGLFSSGGWNPAGGGNFSLAGISSHLFSDSTSGQYINEPYSANHFTGGSAGNFGRTPWFPTFAMNMEAVAFDVTGTVLSVGLGPVDAYAGAVLAWDSLAECDDILPAASTGNTETVSGLSIKPKAGLFYGISDVPIGQNNFGITGTMPTAYMLGVTTPNFEWCACVDFEIFLGSAYQSFNTSFCDRLDGSNAHTGSVELTADGFIATTVDDAVSPAGVQWCLFGPTGVEASWVPQLYRRRIA